MPRSFKDYPVEAFHEAILDALGVPSPLGVTYFKLECAVDEIPSVTLRLIVKDGPTLEKVAAAVKDFYDLPHLTVREEQK